MYHYNSGRRKVELIHRNLNVLNLTRSKKSFITTSTWSSKVYTSWFWIIQKLPQFDIFKFNEPKYCIEPDNWLVFKFRDVKCRSTEAMFSHNSVVSLKTSSWQRPHFSGCLCTDAEQSEGAWRRLLFSWWENSSAACFARCTLDRTLIKGLCSQCRAAVAPEVSIVNGGAHLIACGWISFASRSWKWDLTPQTKMELRLHLQFIRFRSPQGFTFSLDLFFVQTVGTKIFLLRDAHLPTHFSHASKNKVFARLWDIYIQGLIHTAELLSRPEQHSCTKDENPESPLIHPKEANS